MDFFAFSLIFFRNFNSLFDVVLLMLLLKFSWFISTASMRLRSVKRIRQNIIIITVVVAIILKNKRRQRLLDNFGSNQRAKEKFCVHLLSLSLKCNITMHVIQKQKLQLHNSKVVQLFKKGRKYWNNKYDYVMHVVNFYPKFLCNVG